MRRLGPNTYLFTYALCQAERITRRATIWELTRKAGAFSITRAQSCRLGKTTSHKRRDRQLPASRNQRGVEESLAALAEAAAPGYAMVGETSGRLKTLFDEYGEM